MRAEVDENIDGYKLEYWRILKRIMRRQVGVRVSSTPSNNAPLRFGIFELEVDSGELRKSGRAVRLRPQAAKILVLLASRPGQLVTREDLREKIWGNETFVDFEHGLNLCVKEVRAALGDDAGTPRYVETLPKRGYRFMATVEGAQQVARPAARRNYAALAAALLAVVVVVATDQELLCSGLF